MRRPLQLICYFLHFPKISISMSLPKFESNFQNKKSEHTGASGGELFCALFLYPASIINTHLELIFNRLKSMDFKQIVVHLTLIQGGKYGKLESHYLGLLYLSNLHNWKTPCVSIIAKEFHQVEIKIAIWSLQVEKTEVRLVYKEDIEDPNQTIAHDSSNFSGRRFSFDDAVYYAFR